MLLSINKQHFHKQRNFSVSLLRSAGYPTSTAESGRTKVQLKSREYVSCQNASVDLWLRSDFEADSLAHCPSLKSKTRCCTQPCVDFLEAYFTNFEWLKEEERLFYSLFSFHPSSFSSLCRELAFGGNVMFCYVSISAYSSQWNFPRLIFIENKEN